MSLLDARAPARAPGVELLGELQGSGHHAAPGLVRRADGQTVQVTQLLYQLLESVDGQRDEAALAEALAERCGKHVEPEDVRTLLTKLEPLGLLAGADGAVPATKKQEPLLGIRPKVVISDPEATRRITTPFAWLFKPFVVVPVLVGFVATCWWVLAERGLAPATRQAFDSPGLLLAVFLLTVVSAGWHEFGHAAACRSQGATPGAMGAGLYVVWPAFYTDVDDAYRLSRRGRLVVDLGGLYFNAVAAVAVAGAFLVTRVEALLLVVASQLLLMLRQLAPVIRADGYHILADLTGVPDLFAHIRPTLAGLWPGNWGKPQPLRPWARWIVRAWVLTVVPLLLWMLLGGILLLPRLVATAWEGLGQQWTALTDGGEDGHVLGALAALLRMAALVLPCAAVAYQLVRIGRRVVRAVARRTEGRPAARAGAMAAGALLLGLLLWAWWPAGQYQPVQAAERGTLRSLAQPTALRAQRVAVGLPGVQPRTAYALVPRGGGPALLLVRDADGGGLRAIATDGDRAGVAFPFQLPDAPGPGDNQALAVNSADGTVVYDVAVAVVWVEDGGVADNRNEAYALASCTDCTAVAVAFQVVVVIGQTDAVAPINAAVAANGGCLRCTSVALATQLIVTLQEAPSDEVRAKVEAAVARLQDLASSADPLAEIEAVQREVLEILGVAPTATSPTTSTTAPPAPTGTIVDDAGGGATTTSPPTTSGSASDDPAPSGDDGGGTASSTSSTTAPTSSTTSTTTAADDGTASTTSTTAG